MLLKVLFVALCVLAIASPVRSNEPPCAEWNYHTQKCEKFADQNLSLNPDWVEWYMDEPLDGELVMIQE